MIRYLLFLVLLNSLQCLSQTETSESRKSRQEAIIKEFVYDCADKTNYLYMMKEYQACLDFGIQKDSTIAYLWQQKAMPYFKARKYEIGMPLIDKAVMYDANRWQSYRAFIKCIFAKTYKEAKIDFEDCKLKFGNNYVMDHTYNFYIALCDLQLNNYSDAENLLQDYVNDMFKKNGENWVHPTALFYLGIAKYELQKWDEAIVEFDRALKQYPNYSDVQYYKAICLARIGKKDECDKLFQQAKENSKLGYSINEDNVAYEKYPYQIKF
jgi:tetratricopeptide (TPR) repeat protein